MPNARINPVVFLGRLSWLAFAATIILIPFRLRILLVSRPVPPIWRDYTDFLLFASDIVLFFTVLPWLLRLRLAGVKTSFSPRFFSLSLLALTLVAALSSFFSVDPALSVYHTLRLFLLYGFFLFVLNEVKSLQQLAAPLAIQVSIQSLVALGQFALQRSIGLQGLGEYLLDPSWNGVSVVFTGAIRVLRAYGLSDHPNILGGCLAFALVLLFVYVSTEKKSNRLYIGVFIFGSLALFSTFSRSAWLAAVLGFGLAVILLRTAQDSNAIRRGFAILLLTLLFCTPMVWQNGEALGVRLGSNGSFQQVPSEIGSLGERAFLTSAGNELFMKHALTGVGIGAMPEGFLREFANFPVSYQPAHFVILESAAETGLIGATFYLFLILVPLALLWRKRNVPLSSDFIATSALLLSITVVGFLDYYTWLLAPGRLWQWLAWGLWATFYTRDYRKA